MLSQAVRTSSKSSLRPPGFTSSGVPAPCQLLPLITPCSLAPPTLTLNSSTLSNSRPPQEGLYLLFPLLRTWLSELLLEELALPPMSYWLPGRCLPAPQALSLVFSTQPTLPRTPVAHHRTLSHRCDFASFLDMSLHEVMTCKLHFTSWPPLEIILLMCLLVHGRLLLEWQRDHLCVVFNLQCLVLTGT